VVQQVEKYSRELHRGHHTFGEIQSLTQKKKFFTIFLQLANPINPSLRLKTLS